MCWVLSAWMGHWYWGWDLYPRSTGVFSLTSTSYVVSSLLIFFGCVRYTRDEVYIAPSGVQKEWIELSHIFVLPYPQPTPSPHTDRIFLRHPKTNLKESACTPLFWSAFDRRNAGSCIHTHSQNAVMATLLWEGNFFEISHQVGPRTRITDDRDR